MSTVARMIVSTTNLAKTLKRAPQGVPVSFRIRRYEGIDNGVLYVNGMCTGEAMHTATHHWEDFDVPYAQVKSLLQVLVLLEEQPITVVWREDRFILHDVSI